MLSQLNLTVWAWIESFRDLRHWRIWRPFLLLALAQLLVLVMLTQFYRPAFSWMLLPVFRFLGAGEALHYPQFYLALPALFSQANFLIDWVVGSFAYGVAFLAIWQLARGMSDENSWGEARKKYLRLLLVRLPLILALVALAWWIPRWVGFGAETLTGNRLRMFRYGIFLAGIVIETLFVFAPLFLVAESRSVRKALQGGLALSLKVPIATFLIVLIPNLAQLPTSWALRRAEVIVENLAPELVAFLIGGAILVYVMVNYVVVASAVRIYGARGATLTGEAPWST